MTDARLIVEGEQTPEFECGGPENMAIDETLLRSASEEGVTTLRFYGWRPATLTLGYFQNAKQRLEHAASASCPCIRRASGGGAILHDRELTYCFATPAGQRFGSDRLYHVFHQTLVDILSENGASVCLHPASKGTSKDSFLCFQRRATNDVVLDEHKIAGSAQRRWKKGLVQHGSILLEKSPFAPELPGLRDLAPFDMSATALTVAWLKKLTSGLDLAFQPAGLTDKERECSDRLAQEKFATDSWTNRR